MKKAALIALAVLLLVSAYGWWRLGKNKEEGQASGMTAEEIFGLNNPPRAGDLPGRRPICHPLLPVGRG